MQKKITLLASDISFNSEGQIARPKPIVSPRGDTPKELSSARARPKPILYPRGYIPEKLSPPGARLEQIRAAWRPVVGPAKDLPLKSIEDVPTDIHDDLRDWRPAVGPLAG